MLSTISKIRWRMATTVTLPPSVAISASDDTVLGRPLPAPFKPPNDHHISQRPPPSGATADHPADVAIEGSCRRFYTPLTSLLRLNAPLLGRGVHLECQKSAVHTRDTVAPQS